MHQWKFLYRRVHSLHHESTVPTAFTGYAFHPIEGLIVFLNEILVTFLFPIHADLHRSYHLWTTVIHNGGHAGYEIAPFIPSLAALATSLVEAASAVMGRASALPPGSGSRSEEAETETEKPPSRRRAAAAHAAEETSKKARAALNTVRHHDMHHRFPFAHFSLYFTHWDSWLGTEHAGYRAAVEAHFSKKKEKEVEAEGESEVAAAGTEKNESVAAAASASAASDESSEKPSSTAAAAAASKAGLERLASAMEEYALLSQRKRDNQQQQQQQRGGKGARSGSRSNNGESARSSDSSARRPRSPGIGAWRPATAAAEENEGIPQQRRWSGRLTRAA